MCGRGRPMHPTPTQLARNQDDSRHLFRRAVLVCHDSSALIVLSRQTVVESFVVVRQCKLLRAMRARPFHLLRFPNVLHA